MLLIHLRHFNQIITSFLSTSNFSPFPFTAIFLIKSPINDGLNYVVSSQVGTLMMYYFYALSTSLRVLPFCVFLIQVLLQKQTKEEFMYVCVCMYVYVCMCVRACMRVYVYVCVFEYVCEYVCEYVSV